ncbi:MAG: hypothetical protein Ta2B_13640 [Termitinemataceae bacterium]|nr:MAG: hypothetical protein Ta2B_13640 [Termitinemataceae bacterium]
MNSNDNVFTNVEMPTAIFICVKAKGDWTFDELNKDFSILHSLESNTAILGSISKIMRGFEVGRDKLLTKGKHKFLSGSNVCRYGITSFSYIDDETKDDYSKDDYYFNGERLLIRETGSSLTVLYLTERLYSNRSLYSIKIIDSRFNTKFVLACLNSKTLQFYYQSKFKAETELFPKIRIVQVKNLPIPIATQSQQQPIIELVDQILAAKAADPQADTRGLEAQIDEMVYLLYGLTAEEVQVVEGKE